MRDSNPGAPLRRLRLDCEYELSNKILQIRMPPLSLSMDLELIVITRVGTNNVGAQYRAEFNSRPTRFGTSSLAAREFELDSRIGASWVRTTTGPSKILDEKINRALSSAFEEYTNSRCESWPRVFAKSYNLNLTMGVVTSAATSVQHLQSL